MRDTRNSTRSLISLLRFWVCLSFFRLPSISLCKIVFITRHQKCCQFFLKNMDFVISTTSVLLFQFLYFVGMVSFFSPRIGIKLQLNFFVYGFTYLVLTCWKQIFGIKFITESRKPKTASWL